MVRRFKDTDTEEVMNIWYDSIVRCHDFIDIEYWNKAYKAIKDRYLVDSDIYVYVIDDRVVGFVGVISADSIWGLFVRETHRRRGIASELINHIKDKYEILGASVYRKNDEAIWFFKRNGFDFEHRQVDVNTGEEEMFFIWRA